MRSYSQNVDELVEWIAFEIEADAEPLRRKVRESWDTAEQARVTLSRHEANHFCDLGDFQPSKTDVR